ncbi:hypothetical protein EDB96_2097 [Flavobacterium sp. S87F.05.LMB.W.Kidney.N]|nr:hypothetical protein EDB96_2097 [Flavobacterium sp. S87F.05.LMB.W.Kidney.N]
MTTAYFLTGSFNDHDNDFELKVTVTKTATSEQQNSYQVVLTDIADSSKYLWATSQPTFLKCLDALDEFLSDNLIVLFSKILTSVERDPLIDKELEGFILNHLEY